jgi:hypothetical protein
MSVRQPQVLYEPRTFGHMKGWFANVNPNCKSNWNDSSATRAYQAVCNAKQGAVPKLCLDCVLDLIIRY